MAETKALRNTRIYNLILNGTPIKDVASEFGISANRVRQIVDIMDKRYDQGENDLYQVILQAGRNLHINANCIDMTYKRLNRYGVKTIDDLMRIDISDYKDQWFVGNVQVEIISLAREIAAEGLNDE